MYMHICLGKGQMGSARMEWDKWGQHNRKGTNGVSGMGWACLGKGQTGSLHFMRFDRGTFWCTPVYLLVSSQKCVGTGRHVRDCVARCTVLRTRGSACAAFPKRDLQHSSAICRYV